MYRDMSLAEYYKIPTENFKNLGVLNPNLAQNTKMFIDPVLLKSSKYKIFREQAYEKYVKYFENLYEDVKAYIELPEQIKLSSKNTLIRKLQAKGIPYLCLGYSKVGEKDRGIGYKDAERILEQAEKLFSPFPKEVRC